MKKMEKNMAISTTYFLTCPKWVGYVTTNLKKIVFLVQLHRVAYSFAQYYDRFQTKIASIIFGHFDDCVDNAGNNQ